MPKTPQPPDPTETFSNTPYGYWVLSSLSATEQEKFKSSLKEETAIAKRHLEYAAKSASAAAEKGISEQDWQADYERLKLLVNVALSQQEPPENPGTPAETGAGTGSALGLAALPENQG